ncbi:hypothetical protein Salat_2502700 [Sesamum alatum]|uniref:Uncharacterized protein n=1 Tax=Sesamum alatum TaxID=300844 RepID=A0AAE1XSH4_9LAMI|nr:hypothetical protein Salat_2502700 [Sesamum alatum]
MFFFHQIRLASGREEEVMSLSGQQGVEKTSNISTIKLQRQDYIFGLRRTQPRAPLSGSRKIFRRVLGHEHHPPDRRPPIYLDLPRVARPIAERAATHSRKSRPFSPSLSDSGVVPMTHLPPPPPVNSSRQYAHFYTCGSRFCRRFRRVTDETAASGQPSFRRRVASFRRRVASSRRQEDVPRILIDD